jgi:hypothetical protein
MPKQKRKLTRAERLAKAERRANYMTIFVNGRQKSVRRPQLIDGLPVDEFIANNADVMWLTQNEMWEHLHALESRDQDEEADDGSASCCDGRDVPF